MQKTKVINCTGTTIIVHLVNNGISMRLKNNLVEDGQSYTINSDPNATYREYWCAEAPGTNTDNKASISSDNCAEWKEVKIIKVGDKYAWRGIKARDGKARQTPAGPGPSASQPPQPLPAPSQAPELPLPSLAPGSPAASPASGPIARPSKCSIM